VSISQFYSDYINNTEYLVFTKPFEFIINLKKNKDRLLIPNNKILCIIYSNLHTLIKIIKENQMQIDYIYYNESQRILGSLEKIVYKDAEFQKLVNKTIFFTAT